MATEAPPAPPAPPTSTTPVAPAAKPAAAPDAAPKMSGRAAVMQALESKFVPPPDRPSKPQAIIQAEPPPAPPETSPPPPETQTDDDEPTRIPEKETAKEAPTDGSKRESPWKLVDKYKGIAAKQESEIAELRKSAPDTATFKATQEKAQKLEARVKELENEVSFHDYTQDPKFKEQYEAPYVKTWTSAMADLKELTVDEGNGNSRPINANDMLQLVNLPLAKAREIAVAQFGEFANDVMGHRKEIRKLLEARQAALDDGHKNGAETLRQRQEAQQQSRQQMLKTIGDTWTSVNEAIGKDPKNGVYFTPVEGDAEGNGRLERGYKLVDEAFSANPEDPKLTSEQRQEIIRKHAAVRHRAAAFGRMKHQLQTSKARIAELENELKSYKDTEPTTTGKQAENGVNGSQPARAKDRVWAALDKAAGGGI